MKNKYLVLIVFIMIQFVNAQVEIKYSLKSNEILTKDVLSFSEKSYTYTNFKFEQKHSFFNLFNNDGFLIEDDRAAYIYEKNYALMKKTFKDYKNVNYQYFIFQTPYKVFASNVNQVTKNKNGTLKSIRTTEHPDVLTYFIKDVTYDLVYEKNNITITPSDNSILTEKFNSEGYLLNTFGNAGNKYTFGYDIKSKAPILKIGQISTNKSDFYEVYYYEFDQFGNWIIKSTFQTNPDVGNKENKLVLVQVRELKYKNGTVTGYKELLPMKKLLTELFKNKLNVEKQDPSKMPLFIDDKILTSAGNCVGNCTDGYGQCFYNDGKYEGFWQNGKKEGFGFYSYKTDETYMGDFHMGVKSGFGTYSYKNGDEHYGSYKNDTQEGNGVYFTKQTAVASYNRYKNGIVTAAIPMNSNNVDSGCMYGDCINGYGIYLNTNGDVFRGDFMNGKYKRGRLSYKNGEQYQGDFDQNNLFTNYGCYQYLSGKVYFGYWNAGKYNGRGLKLENNIKTTGEFKNDTLIKIIE